MTLRYIFILCFSLFFFQSKAQTPYRCLIPGDTSFFANHGNYLRAIAIDSFTTSGSEIVYYPFRCLRGDYTQGQPLDSNGGSWLGKNVIAQSDGTWLFDTYWGDTVTIKTQAALGDSWTLYDDTTSHFYIATIYAVDTFSFAGALDSVKKMHLTAYNNGIINPADSLNNYEIWLSKNHGFVKVIALYLFPFHQPGQPPTQTTYLLNMGDNPFYGSISFDYINYIRPSTAQIYDVHPGDVFEYRDDGVGLWSNIRALFSDSVISVTNTSFGLQITVDELVYKFEQEYPYHSFPSMSHGVKNYICNDYNAFTNYLPEHNSLWSAHYYQSGNYLGYVNTIYYFRLSVDYPQCPPNNILKAEVGLGDIFQSGCSTYSPPQGWQITMIYFKKNGQSYGTYMPVGVPEIQQANAAIKIYPNPANNEIHFTLPSGMQKMNCSIADITGRILSQKEITSATNTIDVTALASGLYILTVESGNETSYQKIEIAH